MNRKLSQKVDTLKIQLEKEKNKNKNKINNEKRGNTTENKLITKNKHAEPARDRTKLCEPKPLIEMAGMHVALHHGIELQHSESQQPSLFQAVLHQLLSDVQPPAGGAHRIAGIASTVQIAQDLIRFFREIDKAAALDGFHDDNGLFVLLADFIYFPAFHRGVLVVRVIKLNLHDLYLR